MIPVETSAVGYLVLFTVVGILFMLVTLVVGMLVRPKAPNHEKLAVYECGEPTIGSSWVQFDLRFYVVALLFVVFDVEVAFFFPWALVFGKASQIADTSAEPAAISRSLEELGFKGLDESASPEQIATVQEAGRTLKKVALGDLLVFFGVVLVGFAYLWKRGDIEWVRAMETEPDLSTRASPPVESTPEPLAAASV